SALVTFHRRKLDDPFLEGVPNAWRASLFKLIVLLRLPGLLNRSRSPVRLLVLAVLLNRSRSPVELPPIVLATRGDALEVRFPEGWLDLNPLTVADLEQDQAWLAARGFELRVIGAPAT